jgi:hypothetical protein
MARCGAPTLSGGECRVTVKEEGARCWLHTGPQCSVCLSCMGGAAQTRKLDCGHEFHLKCLDCWKSNCRTPNPTCPMCRTPFDVPDYRCRLIIEKTVDGSRYISEFLTQNVQSIMEGFGLDYRRLIPGNVGRMLTDIVFDIQPGENLRTVLSELGLPPPIQPSSIRIVSSIGHTGFYSICRTKRIIMKPGFILSVASTRIYYRLSRCIHDERPTSPARLVAPQTHWKVEHTAR